MTMKRRKNDPMDGKEEKVGLERERNQKRITEREEEKR